ncbi:hypothetical protein POZ22_17205 [Bacteroides uniformis]|uniref:Uncharacterized protein n=1 Tax=Bacteroides uniformis TaxID=820 RepID=A0AAW6GEP8_BACUN|nr:MULTISPECIES: hypothetical protein [Bacteroidales]MBT9917348.1 hypothetical protein [Bacteroides salyersiae]MDC1856500.1 hypothetical protein [Bacteroides uniformis]
MRTYKVKRSGALQVLSMATDWSSIRSQSHSAELCLVLKTRSKPDGTFIPKKVVTSGIA